MKIPGRHVLIIASLILFAACNGAAVTIVPTAAPAPTTAPLPVTAAAITVTSAPVPTGITVPTGTSAPTAVPASPTAVSATAQPTASPLAGVRIVVQLIDKSIQLLDLSGSEQPVYKATDPVDLASVFPPGNVLGSSIFIPFSSSQPTVVRVDPGGAQKVDWIKGMVYGIAVSTSSVAWGSADVGGSQSTVRINVSAADGSSVKTALQGTYTGIPRVFRVMRWSRDSTKLFFGKEPIGIGGYILFSGLTNLWSLDPATGKATELVHDISPNALVCIDDLSPDEKAVADHCQVKSMEVIDIASHKAKAVQAPTDVPQYGVVGGARFSPDGSRLAYALARGEPDNEQGWVALADVASGSSTLVATSPAKDYFSVSGWLDPNTILLQSAGQAPGVWTVGADGKDLKRLGDGTFLGLVNGAVSQQAACGEIRMLGPNAPQDKSAQLAEDCFWQAFQECRAATLTVTMAGVDAGTINGFKLEKDAGGCRIVDSVTRYVIPRPTPVPQSSNCADLVRQDGGLLFKGCGDQGDILVPAP